VCGRAPGLGRTGGGCERRVPRLSAIGLYLCNVRRRRPDSRRRPALSRERWLFSRQRADLLQFVERFYLRAPPVGFASRVVRVGVRLPAEIARPLAFDVGERVFGPAVRWDLGFPGRTRSGAGRGPLGSLGARCLCGRTCSSRVMGCACVICRAVGMLAIPTELTGTGGLAASSV
jgi:hypothetical protein